MVHFLLANGQLPAAVAVWDELGLSRGEKWGGVRGAFGELGREIQSRVWDEREDFQCCFNPMLGEAMSEGYVHDCSPKRFAPQRPLHSRTAIADDSCGRDQGTAKELAGNSRSERLPMNGSVNPECASKRNSCHPPSRNEASPSGVDNFNAAMIRLHELVCRAHTFFVKGAIFLQSPLLLVVRFYWGWAFFQTGWGKLMNLEETAGYFESLGIPLPGVNAALAGATECLGGLMLLLGIASRTAALALAFTMVVAYLTADLEAVKGVFSDPDAFLEASPFLFLFASVLVLAFGPGYFSLDRLIGWIWMRSPRKAASSLQPSVG
jgi:putative oxidoreductase